MHRAAPRAGLVAVLMAATACQDYDFAFQSDSLRRGAHMRFAVQTPSKADILFVIDNSGSMAEEQAAVRRSIDELLAELAPNDTSYRIGIVSTDVQGWDVDCSGTPLALPSEWLPAARGPCDGGSVVVRYPHDGARGRLLAAYDAAYFDATLYPELDLPAERSAFDVLKPTSATAGPVDGTGRPLRATGEEGVPWVIDRDLVRADVCAACNCTCSGEGFKESECYRNCVEDTATALVKATFSSNVSGLSTTGMGWEQGTKASLLAVGVDPDLDLPGALDPPSSTLRAFNTHQTVIGSTVVGGPWIRSEAILGVMIVSDEQDCSMPDTSFLTVREAEGTLYPPGAGCYLGDVVPNLAQPEAEAELFSVRKTTTARVALGFIGGVRPNGPAGKELLSGVQADCRALAPDPLQPEVMTPAYDCACLAGQSDVWCDLTANHDSTLQRCEALAGSRYVDLVSRFPRRTFDSICQSNFGPALREFAKLLTSACFDLDPGVEPAASNAALVQVVRTPRAEDGVDAEPVTLTRLDDCQAAGPGWCYVPAVDTTPPQPPQVCLLGFDRLIGDVYDIFVLTTDYVDPTR